MTIASRCSSCPSPSQDCEQPVDDNPEDFDGGLTYERIVALRAASGALHVFWRRKGGVRTNQVGAVEGAI